MTAKRSALLSTVLLAAAASGCSGSEEAASTVATITTGPATTATSSTTTTAAPATTAAPTTTVAPTTTTVPEPAEVGTRDNPVPLGTPAEVGGGWTLTINSVTLDGNEAVAAVTDYNDPPPEGKQFVVANITATYNGEKESVDVGVDLSGIGRGTNVVFDVSAQESFVLPPAPAYDPSVEVFQGGEISGNVVLEVPTADVDTLVLIGEAVSSFDDGDRAFFATSDTMTNMRSDEPAPDATAAATTTPEAPASDIYDDTRAAAAGQALMDAGLCSDLGPIPAEESVTTFGLYPIAELECDAEIGEIGILELTGDSATKMLAVIAIELSAAFGDDVSDAVLLDLGDGLTVSHAQPDNPTEQELEAINAWLDDAQAELGGELTLITDLAGEPTIGPAEG